MEKSLERKTADLADDFEELGHATQKAATHSINAVKDELGGLYKKGQKKATEMSSQLEKRIRSRPLETLFLAAGIGFVIGWLKRK